MGTYGREAAIEEMLPLEQHLQDGLQSAKEQIDAALAANRKEKDAEIQKLDRYANQRVRSFNELSKEAEATLSLLPGYPFFLFFELTFMAAKDSN